MTNAIGTGQDPALEPAAAASKQSDASVAALKKAQEVQETQGRDAVKQIEAAGEVAPAPPEPDRGHRVDKVA
ncbi:MAG: hypothetical protein U0807_05930 [Candidatus Binatia bacterium]